MSSNPRNWWIQEEWAGGGRGGLLTASLATLTLVIGWILVAVLVFQLIAVVIPSQRRIWFESTPGGITLRWKDGAIALPEESESEHLARGEGSA